MKRIFRIALLMLPAVACGQGRSASAGPAYKPRAYGRGGVIRDLNAKLDDILNAKDFGAKCDGVTNDRAAIQNAINYSASAVFSRNIPTLVFTGSCNIGSGAGLTIPHGRDFMIRGEGASIIYSGTGTAFKVGDSSGVAPSLTGRVDIQGLMFDCTLAKCSGTCTGTAGFLSGPTGVALENINESTISRIQIYGPLAPPDGTNAAYGLRVMSPKGFYFNQRTTFRDIHIQGDFDISFEIDATTPSFALDHTVDNVTTFRQAHVSDPTVQTNLRGVIGFHLGPGTAENSLIYTTAGYNDIGYLFSGHGARLFMVTPEANGVSLMFRAEGSTFNVVENYDVFIMSPGNNGTLQIGQSGFPWKPATKYQTNAADPARGVGAGSTNARGATFTVTGLARSADLKTVTATVKANSITAGSQFALGYAQSTSSTCNLAQNCDPNYPPGIYTAIPPTNATTVTYINAGTVAAFNRASGPQLSDLGASGGAGGGVGIYRLAPSLGSGQSCTSSNGFGPVTTRNIVGKCP